MFFLYMTKIDLFSLSIRSPTKMSLFLFRDNFYKNKDTFKIFSAQILEVYRILLVETTLGSIMFCYTSLVMNTMFVPCTALLYDNTEATRTLKLSTAPLSISCGIHLISLLMMAFLVCGLFSQTLSFRYPPQQIVRQIEILGIWWPGVISLVQNESFNDAKCKLRVKYSSALFEKWGAASFFELNTWIPQA